MLSAKEINKLLRKIFEGGYNDRKLPENLYEATADHLNEGVDIGFGKYSDDVLYKELTTNIYMFSAAKTFTQVKELSSLILDGKSIRPFNEFKKLAIETYEKYNVNWLRSEYNTAIGQSQSAVKWQEIVESKKDFPYLQRRATMDANTSPECVILNDIIAPVDSPIWITRSPLTHFDCRCILEKIGRFEDVKLSSDSEVQSAIDRTDNINPLFKGNPGMDKVIFNDSHPYFQIDAKDKDFARRNFNLPIR